MGQISHLSFGMNDDSIGMQNRISQRLGPDNHLIAIEQDRGRGGKLTILIGDRDRFAMLIQVGNTGISGSQVDANGVCRKHDCDSTFQEFFSTRTRLCETDQGGLLESFGEREQITCEEDDPASPCYLFSIPYDPVVAVGTGQNVMAADDPPAIPPRTFYNGGNSILTMPVSVRHRRFFPDEFVTGVVS